MAVPTFLLDWRIGPPDPFGAPGQRKIWFPPAIDIAQLPAAIAARERQQRTAAPEPEPPRAVIPELPVERPWEYVYPEPPPIVRPVLPGPMAARPAEVPRTVVVVEGVPTEVERHPEGDFPAGSIFAPGRTWGQEPHDLDTAPDPVDTENTPMFEGLLDWGIDTLLGRQDWQATQWGGTQQQTMGFGMPTVIPSGQPALPPSAAPVSRVTPMTSDNCGNRRYVTLDRETGKISCKRRRRRRLLTNRDLADLASLKTITGGGAALNSAVIRAVR